jgi:hypothetical protein
MEMDKRTFSDDTDGAVELTCYRCDANCGPRCAVCGYFKHTAVHGPAHGQPPGGKPWGHKYTEPA